MKVTVKEYHYGALEIYMKPETIAEITLLLRYANNASSKKPDINMFFSSDEADISILLHKKKPSNQKNFISNSPK